MSSSRRILLFVVFVSPWDLPRLLEKERLMCVTMRLQSCPTVGFTNHMGLQRVD